METFIQPSLANSVNLLYFDEWVQSSFVLFLFLYFVCLYFLSLLLLLLLSCDTYCSYVSSFYALFLLVCLPYLLCRCVRVLFCTFRCGRTSQDRLY